MNYYIQAFKKFSDFSGRARRKEYWSFFLVNVLVTIVIILIDLALGTYSIGEERLGLLGTIYSIILIVPSIAITVRRLHDTSRSGWWILIALIPVLGALVLLYFTLLDSTPGSNEYGPNPKEIGSNTPTVESEPTPDIPSSPNQ